MAVTGSTKQGAKMYKLSFVVLLSGVACACGSSPEPSQFSFKAETVLDAGTKLGGCAVGDLDPDHPGNEIAALAIDGTIYLVHREADGWGHAQIGKADGEMIQCVIGDVMPDHPGNELVAVGMQTGTEEDGGKGAALVLYKQAGEWKQDQVFEDTALIHGLCIGDIDPDRAGDEILLVGFSLNATLASRKEGAWETQLVAKLSGPGKMAIAHGGGAAVACADGSVLQLKQQDGQWTSIVLDKVDAGQSRIDSDGERLLVARDDGVLSLLSDGKQSDIRKENSKLRGAVLADLDPNSKGLEAASAGYDMAVNVLWPEEGGWRAVEVFKDTGKLHHLAAGRFEGVGGGECLVTCGYSGRLTVIHFQ